MSELKEIFGEKLVLTVDEAAHFLGCSKSLIYAMWKRKEGPKRTKISGKVYITTPNLLAYLKECEVAEENNGAES